MPEHHLPHYTTNNDPTTAPRTLKRHLMVDRRGQTIGEIHPAPPPAADYNYYSNGDLDQDLIGTFIAVDTITNRSGRRRSFKALSVLLGLPMLTRLPSTPQN